MAKGAESFSNGESCAFCSASAALACAALLSFQITTSQSPLQVLHRIARYMSPRIRLLEDPSLYLFLRTSLKWKSYTRHLAGSLGKVAFGLCSHGDVMIIEL